MKKTIYLLICVSILFSAFLAIGQSLKLNEEQIKLINELVEEKYLILEPTLNTAYIHPVLWNQLDIKAKQNFAASLAIYCENVKKSNTFWVEIYDMYSGKKLAKYSENWGFKVY